MTLTPIAGEVAEFDLLPARADTDSWTAIVDSVARLAQQIAGTDFVPKGLRNSVPATAAAMLYGREVGLPPMTALSVIHVVEGRPGMSAEAMRSLVLAAGHEIVFDEATGAICRMRARRNRSSHWTALAWTIDQARAAGLAGKDNWRKYPRAMLIARCSADLCRMVFPDVIHGFRAIEEIEDLPTEEAGAPALGPASSSTTVQRRPRKRAAPSPPVTHGDEDEGAAPPISDNVPSATRAVPPSPHDSSAGPPPLPDEPGYDAATSDPAQSGEVAAPGEGDAPNPSPPPVTPTDAAPGPTPRAAASDPGPRLVNRATLRMMFREFTRLGVTDHDRDKRLAILATILGRPVASANDLTQEEGSQVTAMISASRDLDALRKLVDLTVDDPLPEEANPIREDPVEATLLDVEGIEET